MSTPALSTTGARPTAIASAVPGLTSKVVSGTAYVFAGQIAVLAASLIATPFTIRLLGPERYGLLALLNLVISYLCYTDFGMNAASTKLSGEHHSAGNDEAESTTVWTAFASSAVTGSVFALLTFLFTPMFVERALVVPANIRAEAIPAIRIAVLVFLGRSLSSVMNSPQLVRLRMKSVTLINSSVAVGQIFCVPIAIWFTGSLATAMWCVAAITASGLVAHLVVGRRLLTSLAMPNVDRAALRALWLFGTTVTFGLVADLVLTNFERLILTGLASLAALAHYSVAYTLASLVIMLPTAIGQTLFPAFSRLTESPAELAKLYSRAMTVTMLVLTPVTAIVLLLAKPILRIWAGIEYAQQSYTPCVILLAAIWIQSVGYVAHNLLLVSGEASVVAKWRWAEVIPYLFVASFLVARYGSTGAASAWAIRVAIDVAILLLLAKRSGAVPTRWVSARTMFCTAGLIAAVVCTAFVSSLVARYGLTAFVLAIYSILVWNVGLSADDRVAVASILRPAR